MRYWIMDAKTAEEFYRRCIEREAITLDERMAVMEEMRQEFELETGEFNDEHGAMEKGLRDGGGVIGMQIKYSGNDADYECFRCQLCDSFNCKCN